MPSLKYITPAKARQLYKQAGFGEIGKFTIVDWCKKHHLGIKIGGRWKVDHKKFVQFLKKGTHQ